MLKEETGAHWFKAAIILEQIKKDKNVKSNSFNQNVLIHGHCHQKSQDRMKGLKNLLSELNINNKMIDSSEDT